MRSTAGVTGVSSMAAPLPLCDGVLGTKLSGETEAPQLLSAALLSLLAVEGTKAASSTEV